MAITKDGHAKVRLDCRPDGRLELEESDLRDQPSVIWRGGGSFEVILPQANGKFVVARSGEGPFSDGNWVPGPAYDTLEEAQQQLDLETLQRQLRDAKELHGYDPLD